MYLTSLKDGIFVFRKVRVESHLINYLRNSRPEITNFLRNSRPDPKNGVSYKKTCILDDNMSPLLEGVLEKYDSVVVTVHTINFSCIYRGMFIFASKIFS